MGFHRCSRRGRCEIALVALLAACSGSPRAPGDDAGAPFDAVVPGDAVVPADAPALDVPTPVAEAGADAVVEPPDAEADAPTCGACTPTGECATAACVDGACVETPAADGTICGEMGAGVCVDGVCRARACGDGWIEPGPTPMREGCDDGNVVDGDACSASCLPTPFVVATDAADLYQTRPTLQGTAIAPDPTGALLFVWTEAYTDRSEVRARRYTRGGVPLPVGGADPLFIAPETGHPPWGDPSAAGLPGGGWVVVWAESTTEARDIRYRLVAPDGALGAVRTANAEVEGYQTEPHVAPLSDGFVIVWTDANARPYDPGIGVRARLFDAVGTPRGDDIVVPTTVADREGLPTVASDGDEFLVAWAHAQMTTFGARTVRARRFRAGVPIDATELLIAGDPASGPHAASLGGGDYAIAFTSFRDDPWGDIHAIVARAGETPSPTGAVAIAADPAIGEIYPVVAPLRGGAYVVAWLEGIRRNLAFAPSPGAMLAPEAAILAARIETGTTDYASLTATGGAVWFAFFGWVPGVPADSFSAFRLPIE